MQKMAPGFTIFLFCLLFPFHVDAGTISYTYDDLYRLIKVDYGNGETIEYTYDAAGNRLTRTITANQLKAYFSADVTSGGIPLHVSFTDHSTGDVKSWQWDFGDGTKSQTQDPVHDYGKAGSYTVKLTVAGSGETVITDNCSKTGYITVYAAPVAAFSASPRSGKHPLKVNFTDKSTGNISGRLWDFGDGQPSSPLKNPAHTYSEIGTYKPTLTVTGPGGTGIKTHAITVTE
jgi:YD repeat-containing protein